MLPWRLIEAPLSTFVYAAFETMSELHEQPRLNRFPSLLLHQHAAGLDCFWSMWILVLSQLQVAEATFFSGEVAVCVLSVTVKRICVCCLLSFDAVEGAVTAVIRCSKEKHSPPPNLLWQVWTILLEMTAEPYFSVKEMFCLLTFLPVGFKY